jgi:hypothetical protein
VTLGDKNQAQNEMRQRQKEPEIVLLAQPDRKSADGKISGANPRPDPPCAARDEKDSALDEIEPGTLRLTG